jgi:hypothetical protein
MGALSLILSALLLLQDRPQKVFEGPVGDAFILRATAEYTPVNPGVCCRSQFRLVLLDKTNLNRSWEIASISENYEYRYRIRRPTKSSIIVDRRDSDYGIDYGSMALFFDTQSKSLLKRIDFKPGEALQSIAPDEVRRVGLDPAIFSKILAVPLVRDQDSTPLPEGLPSVAPLKSTFAEFAKARPARVRQGYSSDVVTLEETVGAWQIADGRIWFGKTFYDGEGYTGVGGIGYFDISKKAFSFLRIPQIVDWSVSALLVKDQVLWAGLEGRPEAAEFSGGLLRHDLRTSATRVFRVEDVITSLHSTADALILGTTNGIYVLRNDRLTRHRVMPTLDGKFVFYTETP